MRSPNALNLVSQFHREFESPILDFPQLISPERAALRVSLLSEELDELKEAIAQGNLVEVADALCDLEYVLAGAILEFGMGEQFPAMFTAVHRSNMSKACATEEEARQTVLEYFKKGQAADFKATPNGFLVYRIADKKTLKSINYSPVDLSLYV